MSTMVRKVERIDRGVDLLEITITLLTNEDVYLALDSSFSMNDFFIEKIIPQMGIEHVKTTLAAAAARRLQL